MCTVIGFTVNKQKHEFRFNGEGGGLYMWKLNMSEWQILATQRMWQFHIDLFPLHACNIFTDLYTNCKGSSTQLEFIINIWLLYIYIRQKIKWSRSRPGVAQRVGRGIALLFHARGTRRGWVVNSTPWPHFTPGKTRYSFYRRMGGPQGRYGRAENLVATGIRSRTVQPIVSRYTAWATRPLYIYIYI